MDSFVYEPIDLGRPALRLLHLLRGKGWIIECILYQAFLDGTELIPYEALSYTWGGADKTSTVKVNGKSLNVTENLYLALQHLRSEHIDRVIWIDAVCIDQSNERERGHQVQQMCKIYSQAEEVVVWLGQATRETDDLMGSLQRLEELSSLYAYGHSHWKLAQWTEFWLSVPKNSDFELRKGLGLLLSRPWFRRVWILQEIANAKKASISCGTKSIRAHTFALAPLLMGIKPDRHCQAVLDIMPGRLRENTWWTENRDLYNLLLKFSESQASDPRDKVYALLGISSDLQDTDSLLPDYTKSLQKVIQDTSSFLFGPSHFSFQTMPEFLKNLTFQNVASFVRLASLSDVSEVDHFLRRRCLEVPLSTNIIEAAAGNKENGREIMSLLLRDRGEEFMVTEGVIEAAARNEGNGQDIMTLLLRERGKEFVVTERVVKAAARNEGNGQDIMTLLLRERKNQFSVTKGVIEAAGRNKKSKLDMINFLLQEFEDTFRSIVCEELIGFSRYNTRVRKLVRRKTNSDSAPSGMYEITSKASPERIRIAVEMLLLNPGANVDMKGRKHSTASKRTKPKRYEAVVRLLLEPSASSIAHSSSWTREIAHYLGLSPRRSAT
jgi:hypothetical protein